MRQLIVSLVLLFTATAVVAIADTPKGAPGRVIKPAEAPRIAPAPKRKVLGALAPAPFVRGQAFLEPDNTLMVLRRKSEGGAAGAFTLKPSGEWDKVFVNAPPNIVRDLAELGAYLDQVVASAP